MEEMNEEQLHRLFPFDVYGRYAIIRDIVNHNRSSGEKFRILDVGGRGNLMKKFLLTDDVFYLDLGVVTNDENYIEGDGCDMQFEDNSFDFVVSTDVFEHVAPPKRESFLSENMRVARLAVILAAPFYSKETELAEIYANENFKIISKGEDHCWLKEHLENGLPDIREVEDFIKNNSLRFQKIPNNNLWLWENLTCSSFITGERGEEFRDFNQFYNEKVFPYDHEENSYRQIYFIKKDKGLKDLKLKKDGINSSLYLEAIKKNFDLLFQMIREKEDHIKKLRDIIQEKDNHINNFRQMVAEKDRLIEELTLENRAAADSPLKRGARGARRAVGGIKDRVRRR